MDADALLRACKEKRLASSQEFRLIFSGFRRFRFVSNTHKAMNLLPQALNPTSIKHKDP